ncbi:unnamed protein product, partial [Iphiclides podalirius]
MHRASFGRHYCVTSAGEWQWQWQWRAKQGSCACTPLAQDMMARTRYDVKQRGHAPCSFLRLPRSKLSRARRSCAGIDNLEAIRGVPTLSERCALRAHPARLRANCAALTAAAHP